MFAVCSFCKTLDDRLESVHQKIYDSKTAALVDFVPIEEGKVGMYVCGPTVQSAPHIGHLRSALVYDQMRRWFTATGFEVTLVRNVTDIDDKILINAHNAQEAGGTETWWALAYRVEEEFAQAYKKLGVQNPTVQPRATGHIGQMSELIERLFAKGYAYESADGSIYFDTAKWAEYGALTKQSIEAMSQQSEHMPGKRNPSDFALWKAHRQGEPEDAKWEIARGKPGRPGWHIECSAMATRYLGDTFDIHGGGRDLRFPHHENELAQSNAAGDRFANYWVHNGLVNVGDQKMSKSLGNSLYAHELLQAAKPLTVRYLLGSAHYRSTLAYSDKALQEADAAIDRIAAVLDRAEKLLGEKCAEPMQLSKEVAYLVPKEFAEAMCDDFALPQALAQIHQSIRALNTALDEEDTVKAAQISTQLTAMLCVLNIDPRSRQWAQNSADSRVFAALDALVQQQITKRKDARKVKDWAASDAIRDSLKAVGIVLEDSADTTTWSLQ